MDKKEIKGISDGIRKLHLKMTEDLAYMKGKNKWLKERGEIMKKEVRKVLKKSKELFNT